MLLGGKRYREIVQADWLVCKWEGAGLTNGVRDEQNEGEMATKRENVIFFNSFPHSLLPLLFLCSFFFFDCMCKANEKISTIKRENWRCSTRVV